MARRSTNGGPAAPRRDERDDTGKLVTAAFPAMADAGNAEPVEESHADSIEKLAAHVIRKGRKGNWLATVVIAGLFGTGGFFGMKAAGERRDEKIEIVETDAAAHDAKPAHDGAATKVEVKALDEKVQKLDKTVGELGVTIDSQEKAQTVRHLEIVDELKWLRRNR